MALVGMLRIGWHGVEQEAGYAVIAVPGPSAAAAALSISGLPAVPHLFVGFPPPKSGARRAFRELAAIRAGLLPDDADLSMGMSDDFEIAIEEGATIVRLGTALFGVL